MEAELGDGMVEPEWLAISIVNRTGLETESSLQPREDDVPDSIDTASVDESGETIDFGLLREKGVPEGLDTLVGHWKAKLLNIRQESETVCLGHRCDGLERLLDALALGLVVLAMSQLAGTITVYNNFACRTLLEILVCLTAGSTALRRLVLLVVDGHVYAVRGGSVVIAL